MTEYYKVRRCDGKFEKRYKKILKFYWKLFSTCFIMSFAYVSIWLFFGLIGQERYISPVEAKTSYSGANYSSSDKLEALVGTNMEKAIPYIEKAAKYYDLPVSIYVGIANAESSLNTFKEDCYNPWGIGNNGPTCFQSWEQGVDEFSRLIKYYYYAEDKITPEQLLRKYVGWENPYWVDNVKKYYNPQIIIKFE